MYKAVIFDIDGVLDQSENVHVDAVSKVFKDFCNYDLTEDDVHRVVARHENDYLPELIALHHFDPGLEPLMLKEFKKVYPEFWDKAVTITPGAKELVGALAAKNISLSLASNSTMLMINKFLKRFGFENVFDPITSGEEVLRKKPDPHIYLLAKSKLPFAEREILVIEDSGVGVQAAVGAGLDVAAVPTIYTSYQDFGAAKYVLKSLSDVLNLFAEN